MRNPVTTLIKSKTNQNIEDFCEKILKTTYKSFYWRLRNGSLKLTEYKMIILATGLTFEQIFMVDEIIPEVKDPDQLPLTSETITAEKAKEISQGTPPDKLTEENADTHEKEVAEPTLEEEKDEDDDFIDTFQTFRKKA